MSVILILLILYLHKENHMYDFNFILNLLFKVLLQKQTFPHQSTHLPIYIPISNILCSPNTIVWRKQSPLPHCFVIAYDYKQLLDEVFVIIKVSVRLRLITLTSTLIIPDITKAESYTTTRKIAAI